jgi:hypothetical protein
MDTSLSYAHAKNEACLSSIAHNTYNGNIIKTVVHSTNVLGNDTG